MQGLIETVANETFRDLFAPNPVPLNFDGADWSLAWVAASDAKILGVLLTSQDYVDDLWVLRESRRQAVGKKLLARGESEISGRRYHACRLRVVKSNAVAVQFYLRQGWRIARVFPHEKYHHAIRELAKSIEPGAA
jgi:ribosomal protein S18 acetylase RimI-like enzyme